LGEQVGILTRNKNGFIGIKKNCSGKARLAATGICNHMVFK